MGGIPYRRCRDDPVSALGLCADEHHSEVTPHVEITRADLAAGWREDHSYLEGDLRIRNCAMLESGNIRLVGTAHPDLRSRGSR